MPHFDQWINKLPDLSFRTPVGKCIRLCIDCLQKKYLNEPPSLNRDMAICYKCHEFKECSLYEERRLLRVPPKKRVIPVAERFNIIVRVKGSRKDLVSNDPGRKKTWL